MKATAHKNGTSNRINHAIQALVTHNRVAAPGLDDQIELVRSYDHHAGIGYRKADGKLIEFCTATASVKEITLADSITWTLNMHYAEQKLGWCADVGDEGFARWLQDIRAALV